MKISVDILMYSIQKEYEAPISVFKEISDSIFVLKLLGHNREGRF